MDEQKGINIEPIWKENYVAIAMSCSNEYAPYLSVCLQSLIEHTSKEHYYDILIFERNITDANKAILEQQICRENISLRFINPMEIINNYKNLKFPKQYNLECYFRLTSPIILEKYKKLIFTDVDLIFQEDIANLYSIDIPNALGACQDLVYCSFLSTPGLGIVEYATKELELKDPYKYFNTGVMVLNLNYLREHKIPEKCLTMANERMYRILEQDILNKLLKEDITYIDDRWNCPTMNPTYEKFMKNLSQNYISRYITAFKEPYIVHWAGRLKAWGESNADKAYLWWQYARKTPYYEVILQRLWNSNFNNIQRGSKIDDIQDGLNYRRNILSYWRYKILSKITLGKKREHYKNKKLIWKNKIRQGKIVRGIH